MRTPIIASIATATAVVVAVVVRRHTQNRVVVPIDMDPIDLQPLFDMIKEHGGTITFPSFTE